MKNAILALLFLLQLFTGNLSGQKQRYGYVNYDSLLELIPGYSAADISLRKHKLEVAESRRAMLLQIDRKTAEYDSLKGKGSALIDQLRLRQIEDMKMNLVHFDQATPGYLQYDSLRVAAFQYQVDEAILSVENKNKCVIITLLGNDSINAKNMNADVAAQLKKKEKSHSEPKIIGYVNRDSLLRLIPEYREIKVRNENAVANFVAEDIWFEDCEQNLLYDSLIAANIDSIRRSDSVSCAPYEKKFNDAWNAEMKERTVFYISESQVMYNVWPGQKVQFVSLNKEFAERLN